MPSNAAWWVCRITTSWSGPTARISRTARSRSGIGQADSHSRSAASWPGLRQLATVTSPSSRTGTAASQLR